MLGQQLQKLIKCLTNSTFRRALVIEGVAASVEHQSVLRYLALRSVVDIGANRGQFALVVRGCFPEAMIISFEPQSEAARKFRAVLGKDERVVLHQVAIGPRRGKATLHVSERDDSSSLLPISEMQSAIFPGTAARGSTEVSIALLEDHVSESQLAQPALLKLDVQGYEFQALQGSESLLRRFTYVYVECSFVELYTGQALANEVVAWLQKRGFRLAGTYNLIKDNTGREIQADFLFSSETF